MKNSLFFGKISMLVLTLALLQAASCGQPEQKSSATSQGGAGTVSPASNEAASQKGSAKPVDQSLKVMPQGAAPNQRMVDSLKNLPGDKKH
ncbi:MAG: hypothetical protein WCR52_01590 [Bacteroidota bacterium]